jgi:hypothetical protein
MKKTAIQCLRSLGCGIVALTIAGASRAAVLTTVPMQGGMVMPMISYAAAEGALHVTVDPAIPALTPLLVSNPGDRFNPADPWYDLLDPCRQGLAFSRRYGFVMDSASDPLPNGTAIWIRKLSGSPELGAFRYRSTDPKAWEPIFGTAGSTNAFLWNGMMFHPGITAPPGSDNYSATFEAYLVNNTTGFEVAGSSTGPFTLNWTSVPDGRPALALAQKIAVSWPPATTNWVLETADTLPCANWTTVTNEPVLLDGRPAVLLDPSGVGKFFRMRLAP